MTDDNHLSTASPIPLPTDMAAAVDAFVREHHYPTFHPRAVLFDMDGVLFDSMPNHNVSWMQVSDAYSLGMRPNEAFLHEGRTGASTIDLLMQRSHGRHATEEEKREIYAEKCRLFSLLPTAQKMAGADAVLAAVKARSLAILVVTGSGMASLLDRLNTGYPGFFSPDRVVSSKDVRHGKPAPDPYLLGLEKAGVQPWEAIVIENAPLGVQSATAAGIFTIAVNTGPLAPELLAEAGANLVFPSMTALAEAEFFGKI